MFSIFIASIVASRWPAFTSCPRFTATSDRKSTRLNSSHSQISYAVFCLKKKIEFWRNKAPLLHFFLTEERHFQQHHIRIRLPPGTNHREAKEHHPRKDERWDNAAGDEAE